MKLCFICQFEYPEEILAPIFRIISSGSEICGICALDLMNKQLRTKREKFVGQVAEAFRQEALQCRNNKK